MSVITWSDSFKIGIKLIDKQHQKIFSLLERSYDLMRQPDNYDKLPPIFQELINYADSHFSTEELYFEKFNYSEKDVHIKAHQAYRSRVSELIVQYNSSPEQVKDQLFGFIGDWWHGHIGGLDHRYVQCFHDHGLY